MKKLTLFVLVAVMSVAAVAMAGDKKPSTTTKLSELAQVTCTLPKPDGTIVCHITALDVDQGGNYKCNVDKESCHAGYLSALRPGQTCLGAIVCRPATPVK